MARCGALFIHQSNACCGALEEWLLVAKMFSPIHDHEYPCRSTRSRTLDPSDPVCPKMPLHAMSALCRRAAACNCDWSE